MIFNNGYYHALDREYVDGPEESPILVDAPASPSVPGSDLGPKELGTTTNPMENTLNSLQAKIREGAGKIEFEFLGAGKGNSQRPSPESFGREERQAMRDLVNINEMQTATHAAVHSESLAGLGREGFSRDQQAEVSREIERAINFAAEATRGGAVVFHVQEWARPVSEIAERGSAKNLFRNYEEEENEASILFADKRTGKLVGQVSKDQELFVPKFKTDENGDWIDINGNVIPKDASVERLFDRVPEFNEEKTNFKTEKRTWKDFRKEAQEWNQNHPDEQKTPGEMFLLSQYQNRILQAKGQSLFYARGYDEERRQKEKLEKELKKWEEIESKTPEHEKWKLKQAFGGEGGLLPPDIDLPSDFLKRRLKMVKDSMRHVHEASASADAQAREFTELLDNVKPIKDVGINRTAKTIANAGISAMKYTKKHQKELKDPIFVAPENWMPQAFGSHPDELREVVLTSRKAMADRLVKMEHLSRQQAEEMAKKHIKATLDSGHLNMWRSMFAPKAGESMEARDKRFNDWMLKKTKELAKDGIVGHIHLTDNMGYNDEHLTPGQGNVPMKEFIKSIEKEGIKDFTIEPGSFNPLTSMHDTWAMMGSPIYSIGPRMGPSGNFSGMRHGHFGYQAPPNYIVGAYAPSNEWKVWSEVPLE